jgi:hypothetical protein
MRELLSEERLSGSLCAGNVRVTEREQVGERKKAGRDRAMNKGGWWGSF